MIQIMKASAGSGKTFNLARKYITLLFRKKDRSAYRHILAVTFTNKATDEMKSRILRELYVLSSDPASSGYLKWFVPDLFPAEDMKDVDPEDIVSELPGRPGRKITLESLQAYAREVLYGILHDYGAFSVSTIDRFFQQTLKAFSREIGQFASYQVELDKEELVRESVDRLLDSLTEDNPDLLRWLTDCAMEQVENGERYDLDDRLTDMARNLKSDAYRETVESFGIDEDRMYSHANLRNIRKLCDEYVKDFRKKVGDAAGAALSAIGACGLNTSDFYRSFPEVLRNYEGLDGRTEITAPQTFLARASDSNLWFRKAGREENLEKSRGLEASFEEFCSLFGNEFRLYNTARVILGQLYELGVSADIRHEFDAVLKDRNVLSIDDSNLILKNIIDGSDAPFIYEKTGVRFENFLLDEFQDTSGIQWDNFRPLLENSNAQNFENLIVGDVKQSIYRWRGSEWKLLQENLEKDFPRCRTTVLDRNFRSVRNIVGFNNSFFVFAAEMLDALYGGGEHTVSGIYSDVVQKTASDGSEEGLVEISFCGDGTQEDIILDSIRRLTDGGASYGDIAVLVRNNSSGALVAQALIGHGIPVVTDDSLKVKSSLVVRRLVSMMAYMDNPDDKVGSYLADSMKAVVVREYRSLPDLCESLIRLLRQNDSGRVDAESTYLQSFMDCVLDYSAREGSSLHRFLEYWNNDATDPAIASPSMTDSVRIVTIHKAKGLDFNYVIFPFAETVKLYRPSHVWCRPELEGTALAPAGSSVFDVNLSESSRDTVFEEDFMKEKLMQYIDNINVFYVAMTRAVKGMHIIAARPTASLLKSADAEIPAVSNMSHILYVYLYRNGPAAGFTCQADGNAQVFVSYRCGRMPAQSRQGQKKATGVMLKAEYPSFEINRQAPDDGSCVKKRLVLAADDADYFSEEGSVGLYSSGRLRGVILHRILSSVYSAGDLAAAVAEAVAAGLLSESDAGYAEELLRGKIVFAGRYGWFSGGNVRSVLNEVSMIDTDGSIYRPDRVLVGEDGAVTVIDYKFGSRDKAHERQIRKYAGMWSRKGYAHVSSYLWYVMDDDIRRIT